MLELLFGLNELSYKRDALTTRPREHFVDDGIRYAGAIIVQRSGPS